MDVNYFKKKLEEEKSRLEEQLAKIATRNPKNPEDWEMRPDELNVLASDPSEMADTVEEYGNLSAVGAEIEHRLNEVTAALKRIEENKYGICQAERCPIEEERLEADPTAATCIKHADFI